MISRIGRAIVFGQLLIGGLIATWLTLALAWPWFVTGLLALLVPAMVNAVIVAVQFGLARRAASATPVIHRLGVWSALRCFALEWIAALQTFVWRQPLFGHRPLASADDRGTGVPIVFVHGYLCNRALWRPVARWFAARGHPISSVNLEPVFGSIDNYSSVIDKAVSDLLRRTGRPKVVLIGHSMGGLASRVYLRDFGADSVARVFSLGTPHQGTFLANFGAAENVRQMRLVSPWRDRLAAQESAATGALFTVILSHHDNIVSPQSTQTIAGAKTVALAGKGHLRLALDREVWQLIANQLNQPRSAN